MTKRLQGFLVGIVLVIAATAAATTVQMYKDALTATSIATSSINTIKWTGWIPVPTSRSVSLEINYTFGAATAVTMRCETSDDASLANDAGFDVHFLTPSSSTAGTSDSVTHTWSNAVSGNEKWTWTVTNLPHDYINCGVLATGSPTTNDKATVNRKATSP